MALVGHVFTWYSMRQKKSAESSTHGFSALKASISLRRELNLDSLSSLSAAFLSNGAFAASTCRHGVITESLFDISCNWCIPELGASSHRMSSSARDRTCVHAWQWRSEQAAPFLKTQVTQKNMQALMHAQPAQAFSTYGDKEHLFGDLTHCPGHQKTPQSERRSTVSHQSKCCHKYCALDYATKRPPCVGGVTLLYLRVINSANSNLLGQICLCKQALLF